MSQPTILSIGAAIQDVFLSNSDEFAPVCANPDDCFLKLELGSKADVNNIHFSTGGGATNAAVTFARQGLPSIFMGTVGHDPAGDAVLAHLDQEGVDTSLVSYSESLKTGYSVLLLAPNGERTILTYRGASTHYNTRNFQLSGVKADWLYVSSMAGNMKTLNSIFNQTRQLGVKICFNPGKGELRNTQKLKALLEDVDILLLNKEEAAMLVSNGSSEDMARHLLRFVPTVIISDGTNGVLATDGKTIVEAGLYEEVDAVDRTGAGDAFGSGFLSQWAIGKSLRDSVIFASANSTSVVTKIGAKTGILYKGAILHDMPIEERAI
ncbi:carbohydrate kinase family protein [Candidatus Saccharibacteria bacterium]|nr:carbohydrate kinase family protein [Candidatus Saccharibacteria bacterium]